MIKKYSCLIHIFLLLLVIVLLGAGFFCEKSAQNLLDTDRSVPQYKTVQDITEESISDSNSPTGITRTFRFRLDNNMTEKQLMFYVINSNTKVSINGSLVYDNHRSDTNSVSALGCYWVNLTLLRADSGKEVTVEIQPLYHTIADRNVVFYEGSQYPLFLQIFRHDALFFLIGFFLILFGTVYLSIALYYHIKMQMRLSLAPLGIVSILIGVWKISDTRLISWLAPGHVQFFSYLSNLAIVMLPMFVSIYIYKSARPNSLVQKTMRCFIIGNAVLASTAILLHLFKLVALRETLGIYQYIILAQAVILMVFECFAYQKHKNDIRHKLFMISMIFLMFSVVLDMLHYLISKSSDSIFFTMISILIYVVAVGVFTFRGAQDKLFRDKATGLYNRNKCNELIHTGRISDHNLCFMVFDLNNLKKTNDTYGHNAGDKMIASFAKVLLDCIPAGNFIGRSGGDEFIGIIYNTDKKRIDQIIADLQEHMQACNKPEQKWKLSAAIGYALASESTDNTLKSLYELADKRMYENKHSMKQQTCKNNI